MIDQAPTGSYGHLCWAYDDPSAFVARAGEFVDEGLTTGQRVWYVADDGPPPALRRLAGLTEAIRRDAVRVVPLSTTYLGARRVDPQAQVSAYAALTEQALAAGFTGLRVVADVTSLVRGPAERAAFARYEHLVDRYMRARPMSALCAFDRRVLGDRAVDELACLHPETNASVLFRLFAAGPGEECALVGELDPTNHELFRAALTHADPRGVDGRLEVSAAELRYIDHRSLIHLDEHAGRHGVTAVLRTSRTAAARLVEVLSLSRVRVETAR
ncbi:MULTISPECIES: MEDS domain-containing protein [Micromonospora]|uniref:MEDS: MEthanogen/methylotroph, DcmR Sensory domain n=1 Tax=Micromonospora yangpuensis TaxID=683228 RepID=A0A1C6UQC1_9ACTN|nr:MEDS domain-containing protein [Micromonospora yangpuensis]GGM08039.1 hypothetical protein GCM10012279_27620 [Micromonospora yangpuensis]SCL56103.1 MEDS: MEthanogen/methylotroph, DcmR Sensory domain [Micromonospora yangpuensis]